MNWKSSLLLGTFNFQEVERTKIMGEISGGVSQPWSRKWAEEMSKWANLLATLVIRRGLIIRHPQLSHWKPRTVLPLYIGGPSSALMFTRCSCDPEIQVRSSRRLLHPCTQSVVCGAAVAATPGSSLENENLRPHPELPSQDLHF